MPSNSVLEVHFAAGCPKLAQQIVGIGLRTVGNVKLGLGQLLPACPDLWVRLGIGFL